MKRWAVFLIVVSAAALWLGAPFSPPGGGKREGLEPLEVAGGGGPETRALPGDALVVTLAESAELVAPFVLREDPTAVGGRALALPKGSGSKDHRGRARLVLSVPGKGGGKCCVWARVYWRDSCGNSASLKVGDQPERAFGNDCVYNCWHWVSAGQYEVQPGKTAVAIVEREEGIALDQLLFTHDERYTPVGPISAAGESRGTRRFADDFGRSPGHGLDEWALLGGAWSISFSFDPNRIPNQYALVGKAGPPGDGAGKPAPGPALALAKGAPWYGCRLAFSLFPQQDGAYGAVLDRSQDGGTALFLGFRVAGEQAALQAQGGGLQGSVDVRGTVRLNQWHRVVVERWAWVTRVWVDGRMILADYSAAPRSGQAGLFVAEGSAVFDDVELEEIHWQADDGSSLSLPWVASAGARWYRAADGTRALVGRSGSLRASLGGMALEEAVMEAVGERSGCALSAPGLDAAPDAPVAWLQPERSPERRLLWRRTECPSGAAPVQATLTPLTEEARIQRVAFRYGERLQRTYTMGPYHFTQPQVPDPSDYLDFTPEELREMAQSHDADKLRRVQKFIPLVADPGDENSLWVRERGSWRVAEGVLRGYGAEAVLRHALELSGDLEFRCRLRFRERNTGMELQLYVGPDPGLRILIGNEKATWFMPPGAVAILPVEADEAWHTVRVRVEGDMLLTCLDANAPLENAIRRGEGSRVYLTMARGSAELDDIEITAPRHTPGGRLYTFQQQETDWWREGNWVDHAGNACAFASNWISLLAQQGSGMLWHKRAFGPDLLVGFDVEESSEWFGWRQPDRGHAHHPFDNIRAVLSPAAGARSVDAGYRLEVNSQNRSATVLYRNGKEVARVAQDAKFPIQYTGGHAPYSPRRNHITLAKRGAVVRAIINGKEVLRFADPEPLAVDSAGVGGYNTRINFAHVEVRQLNAGPQRLSDDTDF